MSPGSSVQNARTAARLSAPALIVTTRKMAARVSGADTGCATAIAKRAKLQRTERMVPLAGIEPARCCHHQILSLARLPVPPQGLGAIILAEGRGATPPYHCRDRSLISWRNVAGTARSCPGRVQRALPKARSRASSTRYGERNETRDPKPGARQEKVRNPYGQHRRRLPRDHRGADPHPPAGGGGVCRGDRGRGGDPGRLVLPVRARLHALRALLRAALPLLRSEERRAGQE